MQLCHVRDRPHQVTTSQGKEDARSDHTVGEESGTLVISLMFDVRQAVTPAPSEPEIIRSSSIDLRLVHPLWREVPSE